MNPKAEKFFDAITLLPEDIVDEAQDYAFRRRVPWQKYAGLAACLAVLLFAGWFGLQHLAMGGSGASSDNAAPADTAAPQDSPEISAPPTYGDTNDGTITGEPQEPEGGVITEELTAIVLEVRENDIVVTPVEFDSNYEIEVATTGLDVPELKKGDQVVITYDGMIQETYPARITGASAIEKVEE